MRTYLTCPKRKGEPRVALDVCMTCRRKLTCRSFQAYRNPPLFPDAWKSTRAGAT